jgi:hypothetical protein
MCPLTTCRNFFKETVKLVIGNGENKVELVVPKDRLCQVSEFFAAACSDRWASGRDGVIKFEEEDPKIFGLFLAWVFDGSIENSEDYIPLEYTDNESKKECLKNIQSQLVKCFLLGQQLLSPDFKNAAIDLINANCKLGLQISCAVLRIYANTATGSPLRRLVVDTTIAKASSFRPRLAPTESYETHKYFEEYWLESLNSFRYHAKRGIRVKACYDRDRCEYHEHPGKPDGYSCTKEYDFSKWLV